VSETFFVHHKNIGELPENVQNVLPKHAQEIYKEAYNSASEQYEQYKDPEDRRGTASLEETAHTVVRSVSRSTIHFFKATSQ
jgi:cation transport regulator ChaB